MSVHLLQVDWDLGDLDLVVLGEHFAVLDEWVVNNIGLLPLVWGKEVVGSFDSLVGGNKEVGGGLGVTKGAGEDIFETGHVEELLGDGTGDDTATPWSWDEPHPDGTALASNSVWNSVWLTELVAPVASPHWKDGKLSVDHSALDSVGNFGSCLDTKTDVALVVTDSDACLKAGPLTGTGLLLDWLDLHDLILELLTEEVIDNFWFLDWDSMKIDLFDGLDTAGKDETTKLGLWLPAALTILAWGSAWGTGLAITSAKSTASLCSWNRFRHPKKDRPRLQTVTKF